MQTLKGLARGIAFLLVLPALASFFLRSAFLGRDRALEGSSQALSLLPGVIGQYMRAAFLSRALAHCGPTATICFGTVLSKAGARIASGSYVGPYCNLGLVDIGSDALIGAGVHITSGKQTHGTSDLAMPIKDQPGQLTVVRVGRGSWIGSASIVMADVGVNAVIGAGSVVTTPIPDSVIAAGTPARVIRQRQ